MANGDASCEVLLLPEGRGALHCREPLLVCPFCGGSREDHYYYGHFGPAWRCPEPPTPMEELAAVVLVMD